MLNELELTGRARTHIVQLDEPRCALHHAVVEPFLALRGAAAEDGIGLAAFSSFRDFDAQLEIWNKKFRGERPLYAADGSVRDYASLSEMEIVDAILCWSALPGASRHHWGSEIDLIDRAAIPDGYRVRLLPEEFAPGGVFERLQRWMDARLHEFEFYRPYDEFRGGVHAEAWHVSYAPVSRQALAALSIDVIVRAIEDADIAGKSIVLASLPKIYRTYVANVADAPFA